jgi:hypothetical protein
VLADRYHQLRRGLAVRPWHLELLQIVVGPVCCCWAVGWTKTVRRSKMPLLYLGACQAEMPRLAAARLDRDVSVYLGELGPRLTVCSEH